VPADTGIVDSIAHGSCTQDSYHGLYRQFYARGKIYKTIFDSYDPYIISPIPINYPGRKLMLPVHKTGIPQFVGNNIVNMHAQ
jgi:hypothetical protein